MIDWHTLRLAGATGRIQQVYKAVRVWLGHINIAGYCVNFITTDKATSRRTGNRGVQRLIRPMRNDQLEPRIFDDGEQSVLRTTVTQRHERTAGRQYRAYRGIAEWMVAGQHPDSTVSGQSLLGQ